MAAAYKRKGVMKMHDGTMFAHPYVKVSITELLDGISYETQDVVFIAGSLVEGVTDPLAKGIGNRYSDIDVFVLKEDFDTLKKEEITYDFGALKTHFKNIAGIRADIENYSLEVIEASVAALEHCDFSEHTKSRNALLLPESLDVDVFLSFVHRFLHSICINNQERYPSLKDAVNIGTYHRLKKRMQLSQLFNVRDDIVGNYDAGQTETAALISRNALMLSLKAYLSYRKISYDRDKWILIKLKNFSEICEEAKEIYDSVRCLFFQRKLEEKPDFVSYVEDVLMFIDDITDRIGRGEEY